jgi:5-methylcytosine-specific restriction endonuclease McrA
MNEKRYTLILNKSFQPLSIEGAKKSLGYLIGDEGKAMDVDTYELFTFEDWVKRHNHSDVKSTMRSEKLWVLIPEIIVLNTTSVKNRKASLTVCKRKVFERDNNTCGYCGCTLNSVNRTIDHVVPISKGGPRNEYTNVVACCNECNSKKGDKHLSELGWKLSHKLYSPEANILYHVPMSKRMASWDNFIKKAAHRS